MGGLAGSVAFALVENVGWGCAARQQVGSVGAGFSNLKDSTP